MSDLSSLATYCRDRADAADITGIPKAEALLWAQIADEINDYLTPPQEPSLFDPTQGDTQ